MRKFLLFLALALATGAAEAQIKCWSEGGKRVCGDAPPPGARVTTLKGASTSGEAQPAPAAKDAAKDDAKGAKQGPMTPAEREQDYRKRQAEAQKAAEKSAAEQRDLQAKRDSCNQAKDALRTYESGQRIGRTDAKGERYFLDEAQVAQEAAKARQIAQENCN